MTARKRLAAVIGLALAARLGFVLGCSQVPVVNDALSYDQSGYYLAFGAPLLTEPGSTEMAKGPVYPMLLAAIYRLVGHQHLGVRIVQALLGTLTVLLVFELAAAYVHRTVGLWAALLAALYPPFISYTGQLLTETLSVFLLLAFIYSVSRAVREFPRWWWLIAGLVGGLLILTREEMLVIVTLTGVMAGIWRVGMRQLVLFAASVVVVLMPWAIRNSLAFQAPVIVSPWGGELLWISTVPLEGSEWEAGAAHLEAFRAQTQGLDPVRANRVLQRDAVKRILARPVSYLRLCAQRIPAFWIGGHSATFAPLEGSLGEYLAAGAYHKVIVKVAMLIVNLGIIALGFFGMSLAWRVGLGDSRVVWLLAMPVLVKAVMHVFLFARLRYQVPIMSFLIIFAAVALWHARCVVANLLPAPAAR